LRDLHFERIALRRATDLCAGVVQPEPVVVGAEIVVVREAERQVAADDECGSQTNASADRSDGKRLGRV
jgi:hypothetical protein